MSFATLTWAKKQKVGDPLAKLVLLCLADLADGNGVSWPGQATLAATCECSRETVNRKLALLEEKGLVERELRTNNGMKTGCRYRIKQDVTDSHNDVTEKHNDVTDSHTRCDGRSHIPTTREPSLEKNPPVVPPGFAEFWEAYPLRKARGAAEKAWAKAVKRAPPGEIIAAAERYRPPDPKFTKHPATWLNQDCWTDEPDHQVPRDPFLDAMRKEVADRQRRMDGWGSDDLDAAEEADPDGATGSAGRHPRLAYVADTCRPDGGHAGADPDQGPPEQAAAEIGGRVAGGYS